MNFSKEYEILPNGKTSAVPITYVFQDGRDDVVKRLPTTFHATNTKQTLDSIKKYLPKEPVDSIAEEIE